MGCPKAEYWDPNPEGCPEGPGFKAEEEGTKLGVIEVDPRLAWEDDLNGAGPDGSLKLGFRKGWGLGPEANPGLAVLC